VSGTLSKLRIQSGVQVVPVRGCIYGPSGVGKTTLASAAPASLFLDFEKGSHHLPVDRIEPANWAQVIATVRALRDEPHSYQTLVIDTADWAEKLLGADICRKHQKESIEDFGYGKGYTIVAEAFSGFLGQLDELRAHGMHILFVAHSQIRKFEQPDQTGSFDRYELKLGKQIAPLLKEWCDMLLFCSYETKVVELDGKKKGIGGRERLLYSCHTAAWDAKNRHGFPERLPFGFASIASAFSAKTPRAEPPQPTVPPMERLQELWKQLGYGQEEMTKLFAWLEADAIPGEESWKNLTSEQMAKAITLLARKLGEKEAGQ
jgi:hypothetical protein